MTIREEVIEISTSTGPMRTYIFRPTADGKYPGLLLFSEIFQVTGPIRRTAALLAGHGFVVAAPEIYHEFESAGTVLPYDADARAVLDYLKSHPQCTGKLGAIGICIGGHLSFRASMNSDVLAAVCFY